MQQRWFLAVALGSCFDSLLAAWLTESFLHTSYLWNNIGLQKAYNTGIAFGIQLGIFQTGVIIAALAAITYVGYTQAKSVAEEWGFGMIVGGGAANLIDRILDGKVTNMIRVGSFPIFNIADVCINLGVAMLLLALFTKNVKKNTALSAK